MRTIVLSLVLLMACSSNEPPPPKPPEPEPVLEPIAGSILWSRLEGLEVDGWPDDTVIREANAKLAAMGLPPARVSPAPTRLSVKNRAALVEAAMSLLTAEVELFPSLGANVPVSESQGLATFVGGLTSADERRSFENALAKTEGLRIVRQLKVTHPLVSSSQGGLWVSPDTDVVTDEAGRRVAIDADGRIAPGLYQLDDGTFVAVHRGHWTELHRDGPSILVDGRRFRVGDAYMKVIGPGDPDALTLNGARRRVSEGDFKALRDFVARLVIGADWAADAVAGHRKLIAKKEGVHFLIDFDGTIYQTLDLAELAATMKPDEVRIALNHPMTDAPYPVKNHPRSAEMALHLRDESEFVWTGGELVSLEGYTEAQLAALRALVARLVEVFPRLGRGFTWGAGFALADTAVLGDGMFLASQLDPKRIDPGPAFSARDLLYRLSSFDEPVPWDRTGRAVAKLWLERLHASPQDHRPLYFDARADALKLFPWSSHLVFSADVDASWFSFPHDVEVATFVAEARAAPGERVLALWRATGAELAAGTGESEHFSNALRAVGGELAPESVWFAWKIGDPAAPERARSGQGLVFTGERWSFVPKPWELVTPRP